MQDPGERLADLVAQEAADTLPPFLFFWGHRPQRDGRVGPGCLSQWWPQAFTIDGVSYPTAEHWMMASKARLFGDEASLRAVLAASSQGAAKAVGRQVRGFDEAKWQHERFGLVVAGNLAKFQQNSDLADFLNATVSKVIVEASPLDRIWGIGLAASHQDAPRPSRWPGLNLLGFALMNVRDALSTVGDMSPGRQEAR